MVNHMATKVRVVGWPESLAVAQIADDIPSDLHPCAQCGEQTRISHETLSRTLAQGREFQVWCMICALLGEDLTDALIAPHVRAKLHALGLTDADIEGARQLMLTMQRKVKEQFST